MRTTGQQPKAKEKGMIIEIRGRAPPGTSANQK